MITINQETCPTMTYEELPDHMRREFQGREDDTYFVYRGSTYALSDFMRFDYSDQMPHPGNGWHGYQSFTYWSGIVIRVNPSAETITAALFMTDISGDKT